MVSLVAPLLLLAQWGLTVSVPVQNHMVDMTHVFDHTTLNHPILDKFKTYTVQEGFVNNTYWLFYEDIFSGTHSGTHMDAPAHFSEHGKTMDQLSISNFFGPAAVIDITRKANLDPDAELGVEDLVNWERQTGLSLDGHIVLMSSGWSKRWGDRTSYLGTSTEDPNLMHYPGVCPKAAQWLVQNRNVLGVGVDSVALDNGLRRQYPTHRVLLGAGMFLLENVDNVDQLPISGAQLIVLPMKIGGGSGAPVRIVATFSTTPHSLNSRGRSSSWSWF